MQDWTKVSVSGSRRVTSPPTVDRCAGRGLDELGSSFRGLDLHAFVAKRPASSRATAAYPRRTPGGDGIQLDRRYAGLSAPPRIPIAREPVAGSWPSRPGESAVGRIASRPSVWRTSLGTSRPESDAAEAPVSERPRRVLKAA